MCLPNPKRVCQEAEVKAVPVAVLQTFQALTGTQATPPVVTVR